MNLLPGLIIEIDDLGVWSPIKEGFDAGFHFQGRLGRRYIRQPEIRPASLESGWFALSYSHWPSKTLFVAQGRRAGVSCSWKRFRQRCMQHIKGDEA